MPTVAEPADVVSAGGRVGNDVADPVRASTGSDFVKLWRNVGLTADRPLTSMAGTGHLDRHKTLSVLFTEAADGNTERESSGPWCLLDRALAPLFRPAIIIIRKRDSHQNKTTHDPPFFNLLHCTSKYCNRLRQTGNRDSKPSRQISSCSRRRVSSISFCTERQMTIGSLRRHGIDGRPS